MKNLDSNAENPSLLPLFSVMGLALFMAPISLLGARHFGFLVQAVSVYAPVVNDMAKFTLFPTEARSLLAGQWAFLPIYIVVLFFTGPPWGMWAHRGAKIRAKEMTFGKGVLLIGFILFGIMYILSVIGIAGMRTLSNGFLAEDPAGLAPQLRVFFYSRSALAMYAWLSALGEAFIIWGTFIFGLNLRAYLGFDDD